MVTFQQTLNFQNPKNFAFPGQVPGSAVINQPFEDLVYTEKHQMINIASLRNEQNLSAYRQNLLNKLRPTLERLDVAKLDDKSKIEISEKNGDWVLRLAIIPAEVGIPPLSLSASKQQCNLGFADGEQIECHSNPEGDGELVDMVVKYTERYLEGITVLEYYNRYERLIRKECFFGINTETDKKCGAGVSSYPLVFPKKVYSTRKRTFRFLL